jgi:hypothetical protein
MDMNIRIIYSIKDQSSMEIMDPSLKQKVEHHEISHLHPVSFSRNGDMLMDTALLLDIFHFPECRSTMPLGADPSLNFVYASIPHRFEIHVQHYKRLVNVRD